MSFKTHLIIVSVIILAVYFAWQMLKPAPNNTPQATTENSSPYSIIIVHASWGLNCRSAGKSPAPQSEGFAPTENQAVIAEDNVLATVSSLCNNKLDCAFTINTETLGKDPAPNCDKELTVEYRCFNYDRPWTIKSASRSISIDCNQSNKQM